MDSFFPPDPPADDHARFAMPEKQPWWAPPEDELPVFLPVAERIAVTPRVAVFLEGVRVYREGVEFRVDRRMRKGDLSRRDWKLAQEDFHGFLGLHHPDRLRFGLALGDGEKVLLDTPGFPGTDRPPGHTFRQTDGNGHGSDSFYRTVDRLWLWPLPPEGPLEFVTAWPAQGIPETRIVLDGSRLRELAAGAAPAWE